MGLAEEVATWSTCVKLKVGVIIARETRVISTGYNGSVSGAEHCEERFRQSTVGHSDWAETHEIHAELNALLFAAKHGLRVDDAIMVSTVSPCLPCANAAAQAGIKLFAFKTLHHETDLERLGALMEYIQV
jgi:dCMP deaminase